MGFTDAHNVAELFEFAPWSECNLGGIPKLTLKLLKKVSAVVFAVWFLVGTTTAHFVKWSVITNRFP